MGNIKLTFQVLISGIFSGLIVFGMGITHAMESHDPRSEMAAIGGCEDISCLLPPIDSSLRAVTDVARAADEALQLARLHPQRQPTSTERREAFMRDSMHSPIVRIITNKPVPGPNPDETGVYPVGLVQGSGAYLAPCKILSDAHVVFGSLDKYQINEMQSDPATAMTVTVEVRIGNQIHEIQATPQIWDEGMTSNGRPRRASSKTAVLLDDPSCSGLKAGYLFMKSLDVDSIEGMTFESIDFGSESAGVALRTQATQKQRQDFSREPIRTRKIRILDIDEADGIIIHDSPSEGGGSGGAMISRREDGKPYLVGIQYGVRRINDGRVVGLAIDVGSLSRHIKSEIRRNRDEHGHVNPAAVVPTKSILGT